MPSGARNWCFTRMLTSAEELFVRNCHAETPVSDFSWVPDEQSCLGCVFQFEEAPTTKKLHMQGFIQFKGQKGFAHVKKVIGNNAHLEPMKGTVAEAVAYCRKPESRFAGPYLIGVQPEDKQGKRTDLDVLRDHVKAKKPMLELIETNAKFCKYEKQVKYLRFLYQETASDRQATGVDVKVFYGPTGTGKTFAAVNYVADNKDYYICEPPSSSLSRVWFDGYEGQGTLILDDFHGNFCSVDFLKRLLDKYKLKVEYKGGFCWANWHTVIITTNYHPDNWYPNTGLNIVNLDPLKRRINAIWEFLPDHIVHEIDWAGKSISDMVPATTFIPIQDRPAAVVVVVVSDSSDDENLTDPDEPAAPLPPPKKRARTVPVTQPWPKND